MAEKPEVMNAERPIVYVREADPEQLPEHMKAAPGKVFSVHDPSGRVLAMAADRKLAFAVARRHDMEPVSVH